MIQTIQPLIFLFLLVGACRPTSAAIVNREHPHPHGHSHSHGHAFSNADQWAKVFDDPTRDAWQQPDVVMAAMELTPTMVVADIGAGTGYFAVRLARVVTSGQVIATDIEPDMVRHLNERAHQQQLTNLRGIVAHEHASGLAAASVDRVLVVHVWHHLSDRAAYARDLAASLRPAGKVFIVDFDATATRGPPPAMRLAPEVIMAELTSAGLSARLSPTALEGQFIIEAQRP
jgi:arsenite methyltransferase